MTAGGGALVYRRPAVRAAVRAFDRLSRPLATIWEKRRRPASARSPQRWLLVQLNHLGDAVLATAVLAALRSARPSDRIALLATPWSEPILRDDPALDELVVHAASWRRRPNPRKAPRVSEWRALTARLRRRDDDVLVDLAGDLFVNLLAAAAGFPQRWGFAGFGGTQFLDLALPVRPDRPQLEQWENLLEPVGAAVTEHRPRVTLSSEERAQARALLPPTASCLGLHVGGGRPEKQLSTEHLRRWDRVAEERGWQVVLLGSDSERRRAERVRSPRDWVSQVGIGLELRELAALVGCLDGFVGPDSGVAHLAAAQGLPVWVVFDSADAIRRWCPPGDVWAIERSSLSSREMERSLELFLAACEAKGGRG